jgi:spore maturation protein CgeB
MPLLNLRIWGYQWEKRTTRSLDNAVMGTGIIGDDYTRAIRASSIGLCILSEARTGASSGDLITARTFQIPACGTFMLHEWSSEIPEYFVEGEEAEFFRSPAELAEKVGRYLDAPQERARIAEGGLKRSIESDYSIDRRMREATTIMSERLG